jgi:hypothetical protein
MEKRAEMSFMKRQYIADKQMVDGMLSRTRPHGAHTTPSAVVPTGAEQ